MHDGKERTDLAMVLVLLLTTNYSLYLPLTTHLAMVRLADVRGVEHVDLGTVDVGRALCVERSGTSKASKAIVK